MNFIELPECIHRAGNATYLSFSMQRSGQHLIIDWICRGLGDIAHINHCRRYLRFRGIRLEPMVGRVSVYGNGDVTDGGKMSREAMCQFVKQFQYSREYYSVEDVLPTVTGYRSLCVRYGNPMIIILRDPANWLASTLKHSKSNRRMVKRKVDMLKNLLDIGIRSSKLPNAAVVNFNRFIVDSSYREDLAERLGLMSLDNAESALHNVPDFGGGSSFGGHDHSTVADVSQRWRTYENDPFYRSLLADRELRSLSEEYFGRDYLKFLD